MLLSVIIPVYNVEKYIRECFDSIVAQKFDDIEFICIDDGSSDSSGIICDEYAQIDNRFVVRHTENKGVAAARNLGLGLARGKYIAWIDPDDYVTSSWIEVITKAICENDWDILVFDYTILKDNKRVVKEYKNKTGFIDKFEFLSDIVDDQIIQSQLWQKVFKGELFEDIVFPETAKCMEDYAVLHKIIEKANKIFCLKESIYFYRVRFRSLVTETSTGKSSVCFFLAKERYDYLLKKGFLVSKIGLLTKALEFVIQYYKENRPSTYENTYIFCKSMISKDIFILLQSSRCLVKHKLAGILLYFDLLYFILILTRRK